MHKYLRSIGFLSYNHEMLDKLYYNAKEFPDRVSSSVDDNGNIFIEYRIAAAKGIGVAFRGREKAGNHFQLEYYFPYLVGSAISTKEKIEIIRESDREGYHGMCDELNLGVELIFFLQDMVPPSRGYFSSNNSKIDGVRLSALASDGMVLLPIKQTVKQVKRTQEMNVRKRNLMAAARDGDEDAMERLARAEMDLYASVTKRAETEDLYSIVNSYFMPEGIESDKYSIMGTITAVKSLQNEHTKENIFVLTLSCNRVRFDVCINSRDLLGVPYVGRRLKANIWMQGMLHKVPS